MRNRFRGSGAIAIGAILSAALAGCTSPSQKPQTNETASAAAPPDLSGVWMQVAPGDALSKDDPPMQPWAVERTAANIKAGPHKDPETLCFPSGIPRLYVHQYPIEILQQPRRILMLFEYDHFPRQIWTDGRKHPDPEKLEASWMGHSIGQWEGDTLVVDSVGFNDKTWLDNVGHPHTEALHLVERFRRMANDTLQIDFTFDDPKAYTKPWTGQRVFRLRPGWEISEQICADNFLWQEPGK